MTGVQRMRLGELRQALVHARNARAHLHAGQLALAVRRLMLTEGRLSFAQGMACGTRLPVTATARLRRAVIHLGFAIEGAINAVPQPTG